VSVVRQNNVLRWPVLMIGENVEYIVYKYYGLGVARLNETI
jgi:hypothetical protein